MDDSQIRYKQYFTPDKLAHFMVNIIPNATIKNVVDLSMGECGLLDAARGKWNDAKLLGADIDGRLVKKIRKKSPYIHIYQGDGLSSDLAHNWEEYSSILSGNKFDLAIANPPFDFYNRKEWNINNKKIQLPIEVRFLLKYIDIIRENGYICIILPYGFLSLDLYSELRQYLLSQMYILKIIKLFRGCFTSIDADTCLILFQKKSKNNHFAQNVLKFEELSTSFEINKSYEINCNEIDRFDIEYHLAQNSSNIFFCNISYDIKPFSEFIISCKRGKTLTLHPNFCSTTGIRFLHTTDIMKLYIDDTNKKYVQNINNYFKDAFADFESILIGRVGTSCIGKVALQPYKHRKVIISDCLYCLKIVGIDTYYLALYLASKFSQLQIKGIAKGSCSRYITQKDLTKIKIIVPSSKVQKYFGEQYKKLISKKNKKYAENIQTLLSEMEMVLESGNV